MKFEIEVEPTVSWADEIYVGNIIMEILGRIGSESKSFKVTSVKPVHDSKSEEQT